MIPRGVPTDLRPEPLRTRTELGLPNDRRLLVNVGREVAQKGQVHLMRVFARLRQDHGDLHLVIGGRPGETTQELTQMVGDLGLDGHVTRLGYTEHVHHVVAHADLFVFPSLMEGLGTALLEAMSIGTPIVAFDIPPVSETVGGHGAILVPLLDEDALYEACGRLLGDERAHTRQAALGKGSGHEQLLDRRCCSSRRVAPPGYCDPLASRVANHAQNFAGSAALRRLLDRLVTRPPDSHRIRR